MLGSYGSLIWQLARLFHQLISKKARLAYPIRDGIPIMLVEEARELPDE
ncbi:MAG: Trm112 family protein [Pseudomonadota bacterium]